MDLNVLKQISDLKKKKNAVILAHNYQIPEVQDIADFIGDSLGLAKKAVEVDAEMIIFCGVHFMAETASILCPNKKILLPDLEAGCSLADSISLQQLKDWKKKNPDAVVVSYVNTTAEIKAESDYCFTSSNAVKIIESIDKDKKNTQAYYGLGGIYNVQESYAQAVAMFQTAVQLDPTFMDAYYSLGYSFEMLGNKDEAKINYDRYHALKGKFDKYMEKERNKN